MASIQLILRPFKVLVLYSWHSDTMSLPFLVIGALFKYHYRGLWGIILPKGLTPGRRRSPPPPRTAWARWSRWSSPRGVDLTVITGHLSRNYETSGQVRSVIGRGETFQSRSVIFVFTEGTSSLCVKSEVWTDTLCQDSLTKSESNTNKDPIFTAINTETHKMPFVGALTVMSLYRY